MTSRAPSVYEAVTASTMSTYAHCIPQTESMARILSVDKHEAWHCTCSVNVYTDNLLISTRLQSERTSMRTSAWHCTCSENVHTDNITDFDQTAVRKNLLLVSLCTAYATCLLFVFSNLQTCFTTQELIDHFEFPKSVDHDKFQ